MLNSITHYLSRFKASLEIDRAIKDEVAEELYTHLIEKSWELEQEGLSKEEACKVAVQLLGAPELIAQQIYETYAQGTWKEALLSALPHFLMAVIFSLYYWQNVVCLLVVLGLTVGIAIYGWHRNKPLWLFPWLGYYLVPVVITGILLLCLPEDWGWMAALVYIPLAFIAFVYIVKQGVSRDLLYGSLTLAPMLVVLSWFLSVCPADEFLTNNSWMANLEAKAPWIVVSFLALAAATISFIRLKERKYKVVSILVPPLVVLFAVALTSRGTISLWGWVVLLFALSAFTTPVCLEAKGT
jgi:hypothetical protein